MLRDQIRLFVAVIVITQCCCTSLAQGQDTYPPMIKLGEFEGYAGVSWIPRFMGEEDAVIMSYQPRSLRRFVRVHSIDSVESVQPDTNWITAIPFHRGDVNGDGVDDYVGWAYACVLSQPDGSFKRVHRDGSSRYFQDFDRDGMEDGVTYQSDRKSTRLNSSH